MRSHLLILALFAAPALAQRSDGPFVACPIFLAAGPNTLGPGSTVLPTNDIYYKRGGFYDLTSAFPSSSLARPDFSMNALFGPARPTGFRLNGISSDICTIFCRWDGTDFLLDAAAMTTAGWGALLFSVSRGSLGTGNAAIANEALSPDGPGADLFSLVLPWSALPSSLGCVPIGEAQRATNSNEMGFVTAPGQRPEMGDFDPFFTFYRCADPLPSYLPTDPWFYFSLARSAVTDPATQPFIDPWFQQRGGVPLPPPHNQRSAATILRTHWDSTLRIWTPPEVFLSFLELGLLPQDDIDALSVDMGHGYVLVSLSRNTPTARTAITDQLMIASFSTSPLAVTRTLHPYMYADGFDDAKHPMGDIAGANSDGEVDGTCPVDPSNSNSAAGAAFGYIVDCRSDLPFPVTMGASAFATVPTGGGGTRGYAINLSGAPVGGFTGMVIGFPGPGGGPTIGGPGLLIPGTASVRTYEWSFPTAPIWYGVQLDFQWAATDFVTVELASTVRLRL